MGPQCSQHSSLRRGVPKALTGSGPSDVILPDVEGWPWGTGREVFTNRGRSETSSAQEEVRSAGGEEQRVPGVPEGRGNFPYPLQLLPEPGRKDREETDGTQQVCLAHLGGLREFQLHTLNFLWKE